MDEPKVVKEQEEGDEDSQQAEGRGRLQQVSLELVIEALEGEQEDTEQEDFGIEPDFFHWSPFHCRCYSIGGCVCQERDWTFSKLSRWVESFLRWSSMRALKS